MGSSSSCCGSEKVDEGMTIGAGGNSSSTWRIFTYKELQVATNGFSEDNKLGEGGFGSVYWGRTSDGLQIAVKKLKSMNSKAEMEFAVEVEVLGRVRHKNLLGLRGCCAGGAEQRLIVYDYMPNLSLLSHLHGQFAGQVHLDWKRRMNIIIGSAQGLLYLHHEVTPHIIHRDIKASNVLFDSNFEPLVADFGFAMSWFGTVSKAFDMQLGQNGVPQQDHLIYLSLLTPRSERRIKWYGGDPDLRFVFPSWQSPQPVSFMARISKQASGKPSRNSRRQTLRHRYTNANAMQRDT
ncbi:unnamed protein product [Camellia sinensis]